MMNLFSTIPPEWDISRVDRVATINARIGWKALTAAEYQSDGFAFLSTPNIKRGEIDFTNVNYISEYRYNESPELKLALGDVLLVKDGNTLGITNIVRSLPRPSTVNGSIAVLRPHSIEGRYLRYVLASTEVQGAIGSLKDGMGVPHLFQRDIRRIPVPLPPPEVQRRIADFLDAETARIDALADARLKQRTVLEERRFALISETMIPGILTSPRRVSPWNWLPEPTDERPLVRLGYICRIQNGLTIDGGREIDGDVVTRPYLRVANVQAGRVDLTSVTDVTVPRVIAERSTLRPGDVLMTEGGDLDKLGRGTVWNGELPNCLHQNHVFALRPEREKLDGKYLALMTQTVHGRCYFESTGSRTTNLASTNSSKILSFPVPLPSVKLQREIVKEVDTTCSRIDSAAHKINDQLKLLSERRQAIITAAVTGQIDVSAASGRGIEEGLS